MEITMQCVIFMKKDDEDMKKRKVGKMLAWVLSISMLAGSVTAPIGASAAKKVKLSAKKITLTVGKSKKLTLKNARKKVKWSSSNKKVATVNKKGKVKALKKGTAKITAKHAGKKYVCKVIVKAKGSGNGGSNGTNPSGSKKPGSTTGAGGTATPAQTGSSSGGSSGGSTTDTPVRTKKPLVISTISPETQQPDPTPTQSDSSKESQQPETTPSATTKATATVKPTATPTAKPTATPVPTYVVTIQVYKDWKNWTDHGKQFTLKKSGSSTFVTNLKKVEKGTYDVYADGVDTNVNVTVDDRAVSAAVNYITVTFMDGTIQLSSPAQQIILQGAKAVRPDTVPGKTGYSFVNWVTEDGSEAEFNFEGTTIYTPVKIYASWILDSSKAAYTAEYYLQNIEDDNYPSEPSSSEQLEGLVTSTVPSYGNDLEGFTALAADSTTISGDGNTVVKYYYQRNR